MDKCIRCGKEKGMLVKSEDGYVCAGCLVHEAEDENYLLNKTYAEANKIRAAAEDFLDSCDKLMRYRKMRRRK